MTANRHPPEGLAALERAYRDAGWKSGDYPAPRIDVSHLCRVCYAPNAPDSRYCSAHCAQEMRDAGWSIVKSTALRDSHGYGWAREELGLVEREEYRGQQATLEHLLRLLPAHAWRFVPEVCATCGAAPVARFPDGSPRYGCYDPATHKPIYPEETA